MLDIAPTARQKGVAVRVDVCADVTIEADPLAVERILTTLMRNAVKFAPEGGEISIGAAIGAELIHFTVEDNGPGIAAENLVRLGRPFEQADAVMINGMKGSGSVSPLPTRWSNCMAGRCASNPGPIGARRRWSPCQGSSADRALSRWRSWPSVCQAAHAAPTETSISIAPKSLAPKSLRPFGERAPL